MAVTHKKEEKSDSEQESCPPSKKLKTGTKNGGGGQKWTDEAVKLLFDLRSKGMSYS
jgi:hypothetical protein